MNKIRSESQDESNLVPRVFSLSNMAAASAAGEKTLAHQPRPQGLLAFQYGGGRREDPGTQRTKTIADWCIPLRVHTSALIGSFLPKQRWLPFEGFVEA